MAVIQKYLVLHNYFHCKYRTVCPGIIKRKEIIMKKSALKD
jgi:hypothetical protein